MVGWYEVMVLKRKSFVGRYMILKTMVSYERKIVHREIIKREGLKSLKSRRLETGVPSVSNSLLSSDLRLDR